MKPLITTLAGVGFWSFLLLAGCTQPQHKDIKDDGQRFRPSNVPHALIGDFDYSSPLEAYLAAQYRAARKFGKHPYVYIYADWCGPCLRLRARAEIRPISEIFSSRHIVMINYDYLVARDDRSLSINVVPTIAVLGEDGHIASPMIDGRAWKDAVKDDDYRAIKAYFAGAESNRP